MANFDVITIGSAVMDIFVQSDDFSLQPASEGVLLCSRFGEKLEIADFHLLTGGGATNTAVGFARRGFRTAVISELGRDLFADQIIAELKSELIVTQFLVQEKREQTGMSVVLVAEGGGRTIMVHRGAAAQLEEKDIAWDELSTNWIHLSSITGDRSLLARIFAHKNAAEYRLSWNPGKREIALLVEKKIDISIIKPTILFVNNEEWEDLTPVQAHFHSVSELVVVTDGARGGEVLQRGEVVHRYDGSPSNHVVDETGAGDAFAVGFVSGFLREKSVQKLCEMGKASARSVVGKFGAKAGLLRE